MGRELPGLLQEFFENLQTNATEMLVRETILSQEKVKSKKL